MKRFAAVAFAVGVLAVTGQAQDAADAAKKLEGTYKVVSLTKGGQPSPKNLDDTTFTMKDGTLSIKEGEKQKDTAKFKLDPSKSPPHIDILPGGDKSVLGIYQTKATKAGLELTIAFTKDGGDRPKDFSGDDPTTMVLKLLRPAAK